MKLGELIGLARELKGLTLRDLEKLTGINNATLSMIETGKTIDPGFANVVRIAAALGLTLERLAKTVERVKDGN